MTLKTARQTLHNQVGNWLANSDAAYTTPTISGNLKRYRTAPAASSASPNWVIVTSAGVRPEEPTDGGSLAGGNEIKARLVIILLSRISQDIDATEATKEAAENWLDDAEEVIVRGLADSVNTAAWHSLEMIGWPRRDIPGLTDGLDGNYRNSQIVVEMELK